MATSANDNQLRSVCQTYPKTGVGTMTELDRFVQLKQLVVSMDKVLEAGLAEPEIPRDVSSHPEAANMNPEELLTVVEAKESEHSGSEADG